MMKKLALLATLIMLMSCSSSIKVEINEKNKIDAVQTVGVILRSFQMSHAYKDDIYSNISLWRAGYTQKKSVLFIENLSPQISDYAREELSFYQMSEGNKYLHHKSIGAVKQFIEQNSDELMMEIEKNNLDMLVVYEVNASYSSQMKEYFYKTTIVGISSDLQVKYLDHKHDRISTSVNYTQVKHEMLDAISLRLMNFMENVEFYEK